MTKLLFSLAKKNKKSTQSFLDIFLCKIEMYFEKIYFITFITARVIVPEIVQLPHKEGRSSSF